MTGCWQWLNPQNPTAAPAAGSKALMLLSDGEVLVQATPSATQAGFGPTDVWYRLTPDSTGNYVTGSWGSQSRMNVPRLYSPTAMLPDGRVFIVGGEYSLPFSFTNTAEIYNPVTNVWTQVASVPTPLTQVGSILPPTAISQFGDDPIQVLPNGQILAGFFNGPETFIYNPATNSWRATTGTKLRTDASDEETWVKLPDGSIL